MGACISTKSTAVVMPERAAVLILCHRDSNGEAASAMYKEKMSVAEAAKEFQKEKEECFICSWDGIRVGERLTELQPWQNLEVGEIYFLLPRKKLRFQVTDEDLSCLVFKAASSLKSLPFSPLFFSPQNELQGQDKDQDQGKQQDVEKAMYPPQQRRGLSKRKSRCHWKSHLETIDEFA